MINGLVNVPLSVTGSCNIAAIRKSKQAAYRTYKCATLFLAQGSYVYDSMMHSNYIATPIQHAFACIGGIAQGKRLQNIQISKKMCYCCIQKYHCSLTS
jgi:hypothetical protein